MKKFEKVLFVYSIAAVTFLFIAFGLFEPKPQNLLSTAALLPLILYFWLKLTSPQDVDPSVWSIRLVSIITILSLLGIYGNFLSRILLGQVPRSEVEEMENANNLKVSTLETQIAELKEENNNLKELSEDLDSIKNELGRLSAEGSFTLGASGGGSLADLLANLENNEGEGILGYVTIRDELVKENDVLKEANFTSDKTGTIVYGTNYPYTESNGNWYKIEYATGSFGWVHDRDVEKTISN